MLDRLTLQRLRDLPIEQVAERVGLHVERHKSLCPFHDDDRTSSRTVSSSEPMAQPRFRFPQGSRCGLYNQPVLLRLRPGEPLWITEGCSDCWAMLSSGRKAVAIPSATTLHDDEVRLLLDLHDRLSTPFHMYPDADVPGERLFLQLRDLLPDLVHHHLPPGCKDFSDYYLSINKIEKSS